MQIKGCSNLFFERYNSRAGNPEKSYWSSTTLWRLSWKLFRLSWIKEAPNSFGVWEHGWFKQNFVGSLGYRVVLGNPTLMERCRIETTPLVYLFQLQLCDPLRHHISQHDLHVGITWSCCGPLGAGGQDLFQRECHDRLLCKEEGESCWSAEESLQSIPPSHSLKPGGLGI